MKMAPTDLFLIPHAIVVPMIFSLNIAEIALIFKSNKSLKTYERLLTSLAITDILVGTSMTLHLVAKMIGNPALLTIAVYVGVLSNVCSCGMVMLIGIDRLIAVRFPLRHRAISSSTHANAAISVIWVISVITTASVYYINRVYRYRVLEFRIFTSLHKELLSYLNLSYCILIIAIYAYIIAITLTKSRALNRNNAGNNQVATAVEARERAVLITSFLVVLSFVVCTAPFVVAVLIAGSYVRAFSFIIFLNSALNPLVYFFKSFIEKRLRSKRTRDC